MDRINDVMDFTNKLISAEKYLKDRRQFAEADAVKLSRYLCVSAVHEYFEQAKKEREGDAKR